MACKGYPRNEQCGICREQTQFTSPGQRYCIECARAKKKRDKRDAYLAQKKEQQKEVKINKTEKRVIQFVIDNPGCFFSEIQSKLKIKYAEGIIIRLENMGEYFYSDDDSGLHYIGNMNNG